MGTFKSVIDIFNSRTIPEKPDKQISGTGHPYFYYRDGLRIAAITAEWIIGDPKSDLLVYPSSLVVWMYPHDNEFIDPNKRREILFLLEKYIKTKLRVRYEIKNSEFEEQYITNLVKSGERLTWFKDE